MAELGEFLDAIRHAEARCDCIGISDPVLFDAAAHEVIAAQLKLRAFLCEQRGQAIGQDPRLAGLIETLAQDVHATWLDHMRIQDRDISPSRREWSTLRPCDKGICRAIARSMLWRLTGVDYPQMNATKERDSDGEES